VPLSHKRKKERGYNQVELVAQRACTKTSARLEKHILLKVRHTPPQTTLSKSERLKNVVGAFGIHDHTAEKISGKHIILLDDVTTTGATLHAAKAALLPHSPASVTCLALAH
jgi:ComF family protein